MSDTGNRETPKHVTAPTTVPPIVGLCASAGGLEAFKKFFRALRVPTGMGFVLVPHLDPRHESLMVELLSRHTHLPIVQAAEGMAVEADHVYVVPPNAYMTISEGILRLTGPMEEHGQHTSMDPFLRSLAEDQEDRAIGVILSGTGSHGTLGMKAIKAHGGMVMVQEPSTALYDRMPYSAISTGLVDFVLPVEKMPEVLLRYVEHYIVKHEHLDEISEDEADQLNRVLALLRTRSNFDFRCYRKSMLIRRIERRMGLGHHQHLGEYVLFLREHPDEVRQLARDLLISVTSFFRDPGAFATLETEVLRPLIRTRDPDQPLRIWVPGCATGEEAYTIAMLCLEEMAACQATCRLQIFATDVDVEALNVARQGVYPESLVTDISPERLMRYFVRQDGSSFQVNKLLRESVVFAAQNVISDAPFSKMDLIACRNLFIYLEPEVQQKVLSIFHFGLNEGGYLFLGPSETIGRLTNLFEPVSKKWRIFRRSGPIRRDKVAIPQAPKGEGADSPRRMPAIYESRLPGYAELAQRLLLEEFAPAAVLVNAKCEILYFYGPTSRYLEVPTGEPTQDLLLMARQGLRTKLRTAVQKVIHEGGSITLSDAQVNRDGKYVPVCLTIKQVQFSKTAEKLLLITFVDKPASGGSGGAAPGECEMVAKGGDASAAQDTLVAQLEYELKSSREDLRSIIEELESSNEELKAANEEAMSMNEEYQSANEELETAKEEFQSLNEELSTVNRQLQEKVEELERANNDLNNLMASTNIATLFLDRNMLIRQFSPATSQLLGLIAGDVGRPIDTFASVLTGTHLVDDARQVLQQMTPLETEVWTEQPISKGWWDQAGGKGTPHPSGQDEETAPGEGTDATGANLRRCYLRRIAPYRTADGHIDGVVVTFVDISQRMMIDAELRRLADVLRDSEARYRTVVESSMQGILLHQDDIIRFVNPACAQMFGYDGPEELVGRNLWETLVPPENWPLLKDRTAQLYAGKRLTPHPGWRNRRKDGSEIWITGNATRIEWEGRPAILAFYMDVTDRKRAELNDDFLHQVDVQLREAGDPDGITSEASRRLGEYLNVDRVMLAEVDLQTGLVHVPRAWSRDAAPRLGTYSISDYSTPEIPALSQLGEALAIHDVRTHPFTASQAAEYASHGVVSLALAPYLREGRWREVLLVTSHTPRDWRPDQIELLREVVARLCPLVEHLRGVQALRESEQFKNSVLNSLPANIAVLDADGNIIDTNEPWRRFALQNSMPQDEVTSRGFNYLNICRDSAARGEATAAEALEGVMQVLRGEREMFMLEYPCSSPQQDRWFLMQVVPRGGESGGAIVAHTDITIRKRAQELNARLATIVQSSNDAIYTYNLDGVIETWNPMAEQMFGYTAAEAIGQSFSMLTPPDEADLAIQLLDSVTRDGPLSFEIERVRRNGQRFPASLSWSPIRNELGMRIGTCVIARDVTERKKAEEFQRIQNEFLERVTRGERLAESLDFLMDSLERYAGGTKFSVLLRGTDNKLHWAASSGLPEDYRRATEGLPISEAGKTCHSRAAYSRQQVVVEDACDSVSPGCEELARTLGIRGATSTPILGSTGEVLGTYGMHFSEARRPTPDELDLISRTTHLLSIVIERQQAEEALRESEERLRLALHGARAGVWQWDPRSNRSELSDQLYELIGIERHVKSLSFEEFLNMVHPADRQRFNDTFRQQLGEGREIAVEYRYTHPQTGEVIWLYTVGEVERDTDGNVLLARGITQDITLRKEAEAAVRESEERFRLLVEGVQDYAIFMLDPLGRVISWNAGAERIKGWPAEDALGQDFALFFTPEDRENGLPQYQLDVAATEGRYEQQEQRVRKDGSRFWADVLITPLHDETGRLRGFAKITRDITARKQAAEAVQESQQRLARLIDAAMDAIISVDEEQRIVLFNPAAEIMFGVRAEEVIGAPLDRFLPLDSRVEQSQFIRDFARTGATNRRMGALGTLKGLRASGEEFPIEASVSQTTVGDRKQVTVILRDITERVEAERAVRENESRLWALFEYSPASIWEEDFSSLKVWLNDLRSRGITDIASYLHEKPDEVLHGASLVKILDVNNTSLRFFEVETKEELHRMLQVPVGTHVMEVFRDEMIALAAGQAQFESEISMHTPRGHHKVLSLSLCIVPGYEESWAKVLASFTDITARKQAEEQIKQSLHEKEVLLKEIHHRVKNNLQVISSLVSLQADGIGDELQRRVFEDVRDRVRSMALVHEKLYQSTDLANVDFAAYTKDLMHYLWRAHKAARSEIQLELDLAPVRLSVTNAVPFGLLLNELTTNALKHAFPGRSGGRVTVQLRQGETGRVDLIVRDNGIGFPPGLDWQKANSLGLRLVQMLTTQLNGQAVLHRDGETTFQITFNAPEEL